MGNTLKKVLWLLVIVILIQICFEWIGMRRPTWKRVFWNNLGNRVQETTVEPPRENLYFMKTHKTGSSTLQNILIRYVWNKNLTVGLPKSGILFKSYYRGKKFSAREIQTLPANRSLNMIFHHMVFDYNEVSSTLPNDTVYITLFRDPATLFPSALTYFRNDVGPFKQASKNGPDAFLKEPSRYFKGRKSGRFWWLAKNGMFYDLGFDNLNETEQYLNASINEIEKTFDLVIILEYFDMGLILLKSMMHWEIKDVAYISMNAQKKTSNRETSMHDIASIYAWNKADTEIYKYFNESFWGRVRQYGESKMAEQLKELEFWKNQYKNYCFLNDAISNKQVGVKELKMFNPAGVDVAQYQLRNETRNNETCVGLIRPEIQWWKKMKQRQQNL